MKKTKKSLRALLLGVLCVSTFVTVALIAGAQPATFDLVYTNPDSLVDAVITDPLTMIASDAVVGHPRAAGAFA